jgi:cobalt-zinc-cadmium efflux system protein
MHTHSDSERSPSGTLSAVFFLNLGFSLLELVGGILTNSVAILSDALHDFGDSVSLGMAWYFQRVSTRRPNRRFTYGYRRFNVLSALLNALVLLTGSAVVVYESLQRLGHPVVSHARGMMALAVLGVLVNGWAALRLRQRKGLNEKVVSLHFLEDVLGWIAVLVCSVVMLFVNLPWLDPVLSLVIALYIVYNASRNLKQVFRVILQAAPEEMDAGTVCDALGALPGVRSVHDWHAWVMDSDFTVASVHLVVEDTLPKAAQQHLRAAAHALFEAHGIRHATVEIEFEAEPCEWCETD